MTYIEKNPTLSNAEITRRYFISLSRLRPRQSLELALETQTLLLKEHILHYMERHNFPLFHDECSSLQNACCCYFDIALVVLEMHNARLRVFTPLKFPHSEEVYSMNKMIEVMELFKFVI